MTEIEAIGPQLIERYLRAQEWKFLVNQDGHFLVNFYGEDVPDYRFGISLEGADGEILAVRVSSETPFAENIRDQAEAFVAGWNRMKRWPKAYLEDDRRARGFWLGGEFCIPLKAGIHQELCEELLDMCLATGRQLIRESTTALDGVEELQTWLRHTA